MSLANILIGSFIIIKLVYLDKKIDFAQNICKGVLVNFHESEISPFCFAFKNSSW